MNNLAVDVFFLHIVVANLIIGGRMATNKDTVVRRFGIALLLCAAAYAVWSGAAVTRPSDLDAWITIGVAPLLVGFVAFIWSWVTLQPRQWHIPALLLAGAGAIAFFAVRTFFLKSHPYFSPEGLFFFNPDPVVKALYLGLIALVGLSAIERAASRIGVDNDGPLFKALFLAVVICTIVLLANDNTTVLQIDGWVLSGAYLVLWVRFGLRGQRTAPSPAT